MIWFLLLLCAVTCNTYVIPWRSGQLPVMEVVEAHEKTTIKKIYDTTVLKDFFQSQASAISKLSPRKLEFTYKDGQNCGKAGTGEMIYINSLSTPDVLILGANATFSADVTVNRVQKTASLLSLVMRKVGLPFDIPCAQGIGSCNYTNPCQLLEKIDCPKEIVAQGWNCRCPIPVKHYSYGPITTMLPTVPLPAFLVDGMYEATAKLFNGADELLCYHLVVAVKEKQ